MALTLGDIMDEARIALRGDLDPRILEGRFVNTMVGRRWASMHPWRYLKGRSVLIPAVAGQQVYDLPRDATQITDVLDEQRLVPVVRMIEWSEWHLRDQRDYGALYGSYLGALNHEKVGSEVVPRLHLTPAPEGITEFRVVYDAGWRPVTAEDDVADLPVWAEPAFLDLTRAVALAYTRPSSDGMPDPMTAYIAQFRASTTFRDAQSADGRMQPKIALGDGPLQQHIDRGEGNRRLGPRSTRQDLLADL